MATKFRQVERSVIFEILSVEARYVIEHEVEGPSFCYVRPLL